MVEGAGFMLQPSGFRGESLGFSVGGGGWGLMDTPKPPAMPAENRFCILAYLRLRG